AVRTGVRGGRAARAGARVERSASLGAWTPRRLGRGRRAGGGPAARGGPGARRGRAGARACRHEARGPGGAPPPRARGARRGRAAPVTGRLLATLACAVAAVRAGAADAPAPWRRSERREPCAAYSVLRAPYFGETHVHTSYSFDANIGDVRADPYDAYAFARGAPLGLPPYDAQGAPLRTVRLARPLDFTAVTDHAEQFGEVRICETPADPHYH